MMEIRGQPTIFRFKERFGFITALSHEMRLCGIYVSPTKLSQYEAPTWDLPVNVPYILFDIEHVHSDSQLFDSYDTPWKAQTASVTQPGETPVLPDETSDSVAKPPHRQLHITNDSIAELEEREQGPIVIFHISVTSLVELSEDAEDASLLSLRYRQNNLLFVRRFRSKEV